jgi:tetratricopeptide (TPR) repeat protein
MLFEEALTRLRSIKNQDSPTALRDAEMAARRLLAEEEFAPRDRGRLLSLLGEWAAKGCRYFEAIELHQEGLALVTATSDKLCILCGLATAAKDVGDSDIWRYASELLENTLANEGSALPEAVWAFGYLARMLAKLGDLERARTYAVKGMELGGRLQVALIESTFALGVVEEAAGNLEVSANLYADAAEMSTGDCRTESLQALIRVKANLGQRAEAARLMKEGVDELSTECQRSLEGWLEIWITLGDVDQDECFRYMKKVHAHLKRRREGR